MVLANDREVFQAGVKLCGQINEDDVRLVIIRSTKYLDEVYMSEAAVKAAVAEATDYGKFIASAPVVIAVAIGPDAACPNEDSAAAACNMLNAAHALGYGGCWIGSNGNATAERVGKVLRLPAGWKIYALFSVGVPAEEAHREKKRLEEVVSYNGF